MAKLVITVDLPEFDTEEYDPMFVADLLVNPYTYEDQDVVNAEWK